jgi:hypothetical protein
MAEIYVPTEAYRAAINAIAAKTGVDSDEIKIALGEAGNIWPMSIAKSEPDEDEAEFLEEGDAPTPEPDFISEEEDENPTGVVR